MTPKRLFRVVENVGMIAGCVLLVVAIAISHAPVAAAGLLAMSPVLVPFVAVEILGFVPLTRRPPADNVTDFQGAK